MIEKLIVWSPDPPGDSAFDEQEEEEEIEDNKYSLNPYKNGNN